MDCPNNLIIDGLSGTVFNIECFIKFDRYDNYTEFIKSILDSLLSTLCLNLNQIV